jgi:iron-sulfur cluster assembly protein
MSAEAEAKSTESTQPASSPQSAAQVQAAKALAITISPRAVEAIKKQIAKRNVPGTALRVGVKGGGCSGYSYVIQFHDGAPQARDVVYDLKAEDGTDVRVLVDKKSLLFLNGTELEWEQTLMQQGFKFKNPNEKSNCGCGHSFTV